MRWEASICSAVFLHTALERFILQRGEEEIPHLTNRERQCLQLASLGKRCQQCFLNLPGQGVKHAVARSHRSGLQRWQRHLPAGV